MSAPWDSLAVLTGSGYLDKLLGTNHLSGQQILVKQFEMLFDTQ